MILDIIVAILLLIGATFIFISALGVVRMPDLYLRMSSSTKTGTLGVGTVLLAAAIYFSELGVATQAIATIFFIMLTAPVAAHMIGRASYFQGVPLWDQTRYDELKGHYDLKTHELTGTDDSPKPDTMLGESEQASPTP